MARGSVSCQSPPSLRVTWTIPHFLKLFEESRYVLWSPNFSLDGEWYCVYIFREPHDSMCIELVNLTCDPGVAVLYDVALKSKTEEIDLHRGDRHDFRFRTLRNELGRQRDLCAPDDILTVLFSVRPTGNPKFVLTRPRLVRQHPITGTLSSESEALLYVKWTISGYFQVAQEPTYTLESSEFPFSGRRYSLRLVSSGYVKIELVDSTDPVPGKYVCYEFGLTKTKNDSPFAEIYMDRCGTSSTTTEFTISRSRLDTIGRNFSDDQLTVFCSMRERKPRIEGSPTSGGAETPGSEDPVPRAVTRQKSVGVQTTDDEEDKEGLPGVEQLLSDYKRLLLKGAESDACLVVCGKEFQAHKLVLRARSPVFEAMFGHDTAEKESGRVVIDDLKPDRFHDFMEYLYTGRVEAFCDDNAFGLYAAADKYDVPSLKSECVEYMRRNLSVDNFCDVITLALRHHEKDLLELAVEFFKKNVAGIILTVKWQQFLSENSTRANELLIKLHVPAKE